MLHCMKGHGRSSIVFYLVTKFQKTDVYMNALFSDTGSNIDTNRNDFVRNDGRRREGKEYILLK